MIGEYGGQASNPFPTVPWRSCRICKDEKFKSPKDFASHLKMVHCRREGGSYICTYGPNSLCKNLPLEGVSGLDYDNHVMRFHVAPVSMGMAEQSIDRTASSSGHETLHTSLIGGKKASIGSMPGLLGIQATPSTTIEKLPDASLSEPASMKTGVL